LFILHYALLYWIFQAGPTATGTHASAVHLTDVSPLQASQLETPDSQASQCTGPIGLIFNPSLALTNFSLQLELFSFIFGFCLALHGDRYQTEAHGYNYHLSNTATSGVSASQQLLIYHTLSTKHATNTKNNHIYIYIHIYIRIKYHLTN